MANLYEVINDILGTNKKTCGFYYYVNHSSDSEPGDSAVHKIAIKTKIEGHPINYIYDSSIQLPAVIFDTVGAYPTAATAGKHYDCVFSVRVYWLDKATVGEIPMNSARIAIAKVTDNIMASNRLGLDWIDSVEWRGFNDDSDVTNFLGIVLQDYVAASSRFEIRAHVIFD